MTQREARDMGKDIGYEIASDNNRGQSDDDLFKEALETESEHYRQFSPFEFTAREFNDSRDPDAMWEAYESGVAAGARAYLKERRRAGGKRLGECVCR